MPETLHTVDSQPNSMVGNAKATHKCLVAVVPPLKMDTQAVTAGDW
jgi:hypothetical protein